VGIMWKKIKDLFKNVSPSTHFIKGVGSVMDLAPKKEYRVKRDIYKEFKDKEDKLKSTWHDINECAKCRRNSLSDYYGIKQWNPDKDKTIDKVIYSKDGL
jgi:hypothetical protein